MPDSPEPEDRPAEAGATAPEAPAAATPKPPPPKKPAPEMACEPWGGPLPDAVRQRVGDALESAVILGGQQLLEVDITSALDVIVLLRDEHGFDYLVDLTAVHWPERARQFDLVWVLYSFASNQRVRVKAQLAESAPAPSATGLYSAADWLEREVYDMFGIEFPDHPRLRRILMPDEWEGFPLRKEYGIIQQDADWVRGNLNIESAQ